MSIRYGKTFRTRRGRLGRYKYVNGRKVSFVASRRKYSSRRKPGYYFKGSNIPVFKRRY